ncbi:MAG TPA: LysR family transcriptional regulator [Dinghuibacter sp.]|uniref:LysR family transcriptional regulator n=1 Tax=Dinghuibacter sp. TaxID=2024697 RepID=UPI002C2755C1|nr:LysR family transcriptional regulator [Dinghuibacter sp.]HTJ11255.1 LysR family transcriptional regulator [Dinghuibacter sp.]
MVNLEWYRTFKAVYQTGSLTAASKALFISQPNVSQHLASLEAHVGKTLFERKPRIVPTDYGKLMYTQIVEPLGRLEDVEAHFNAMSFKKQTPLIRLGVVQEYFHAVLSSRVSTVDANLVVSFGSTRELLDKLHKGLLDFVVSTKLPYKNLVFEPVLQEHYVIAASSSVDTSVFDRCVSEEDWAGVEAWLLFKPWMAYTTDLAIIRRFWIKNFNKRPVIKPYCVIPDMTVILSALRHYPALTVAADYLVGDELKVIWSGRDATESMLYLAYDKTTATAEGVRVMKELCGTK